MSSSLFFKEWVKMGLLVKCSPSLSGVYLQFQTCFMELHWTPFMVQSSNTKSQDIAIAK